MSRKSSKHIFATSCVIVAAVLLCLGIWAYRTAFNSFPGSESVTVRIPEHSTQEAIADSLNVRLGDYGTKVYRMWLLRDGTPEKATGIYRIAPGDRVWSVAGRIRDGRSSTVDVTFNNVRTLGELAQRVSTYFLWPADSFEVACARVLSPAGFSPAQYPAAFVPDTYQFYASASPDKVVSTMLGVRNDFWTADRREKANALGLTPVEVATLASIVEEESNNTAERPVIARLYLNRLNKGMKLQADPTVKFATGDFSLRRINSTHLQIPSPYNTYLNIGLPPGPIRIAERSAIDAVLNAPANNYLYMCARTDGSGTHDFAADYATHQVNARRYRDWLNSRDIH